MPFSFAGSVSAKDISSLSVGSSATNVVFSVVSAVVSVLVFSASFSEVKISLFSSNCDTSLNFVIAFYHTINMKENQLFFMPLKCNENYLKYI